MTEDDRWVAAGTLLEVSTDPERAARIDAALARFPLAVFDTSTVAVRGDRVPADSVWAMTLHPGPMPDNARYGTKLSQKFAMMGTLQGRRLDEIVSIGGLPGMIQQLADGKSVRIWQQMGLFSMWQAALIFDRYELCVGVSSELAV